MDEAPSQTLKQLIQSLEGLLKLYQQQAFSKPHFSNTLLFAEQLLNQFKNRQDPFTAFLILPFSRQNSLYQALAYCISSMLVGHANKLNQTSCQQLICAAVCAAFHLTEKREKPDKRLLLTLKRNQQDIWLNAYKLLPILFKGKLNTSLSSKLNKEQVMFYLATQIGKQDGNLFSHKLQTMALMLPSHFRTCLHGLCIYPSMLPPGSFVKQSDDCIYVVLSRLEEGYLVRRMKPKCEAPISEISTSRDVTLAAPQVVKSVSILDSWWDSEWLDCIQQSGRHVAAIANSFRLDAPPASLLNIQRELQQQSVDINKVTSAIEAEPLFANHLQHTATQASRQNLDIKNVKHGLMMQGFERTADLLMRQALLLRINQHSFPLQDTFLQFVQLRAQIAALISEQVLGSVYAEEAKTLVTFASAGLFTCAELKSRQLWSFKQNNHHDICQLLTLRNAQQLKQHAIKLARAWQQSENHVKALQLQDKIPKSLNAGSAISKWACILGVSLVLARRMWFSTEQKDANTQAYMLDAAKFLKVSQLQLDEMMMQAVTSCNSYCAMDRAFKSAI